MTENTIYLNKLLDISKQYDIDKKSFVNIHETHMPFEGFPSKSPFNTSFVRIFTEPFIRTGQFYEFSLENIDKVEDLGQITNENGDTINKVRLWAKKGSPAIKSESFIVK